MFKLPKGLSIVSIGDITIAKLYNTNIVVINRTTNCITLSHGNWLTKHTKKCMNLVLAKYNINIFQKNFNWYVGAPSLKTSIEFKDGMEISFYE